MRSLMLKLWKDDGGALIAVEWVFVATILVLGVIIGLVAVRNAVNAELTTFANAVLSLQQCYSFNGQSLVCPNGNVAASTCGSAAVEGPPSRFNVTSNPSTPNDITVNPCQ